MIILERLPFKLRKLLNKDYINKLNNCCLTECLWLFYKEQTSCSAFCNKGDLILIFFCEIFLWVFGKPYHIFHQLSFLKAKNIQFPQLLPIWNGFQFLVHPLCPSLHLFPVLAYYLKLWHSQLDWVVNIKNYHVEKSRTIIPVRFLLMQSDIELYHTVFTCVHF